MWDEPGKLVFFPGRTPRGRDSALEGKEQRSLPLALMNPNPASTEVVGNPPTVFSVSKKGS